MISIFGMGTNYTEWDLESGDLQVYDYFFCWDAFLYKIAPDTSIIWKYQWGSELEDRGFSITQNNGSLLTINYQEASVEGSEFLSIEPSCVTFEGEQPVSISNFDKDGNLLSTSPLLHSDIRIAQTVLLDNNTLLMSGSVSEDPASNWFSSAPALRKLNLNTMEEVDILPNLDMPGDHASDYVGINNVVVLDSSHIAILLSYQNPDFFEVIKVNTENNTQVLLHQIPDYPDSLIPTLGAPSSNAYKSPWSQLIKHSNGDLYYLVPRMETDLLIRVTQDASVIGIFEDPEFILYPTSKMTVSETGDLIIVKRIYLSEGGQYPNVPSDYKGEVLVVTIVDEDFTEFQNIYKPLKPVNDEPQYTIDIAGVKTQGNYAYIYGKYGIKQTRGFIWRFNLNEVQQRK